MMPPVYKCVSPKMLINLSKYKVSESVLIEVARDIPNLDVFESVKNQDITPSEGADILIWKRRGDPWYIRFLRWMSGK